MKRTKLLCLLLSLSLLACTAGCKPAPTPGPEVSTPPSSMDASQSQGPSVPEQPDGPAPAASVMVLSGPTGVGAAKLMADSEAEAAPAYSFQVVSDNSEVTAALIRPDDPVDIACIATNVAANLYNKSDGAIQVLAVNTLGVLYILEKGQKVSSMADLRGRTIFATGQGANPEFILDHLLTENELDPEKDVEIQWMTPQEVTAKMAASSDGVCMLPVPAATALLMKDTAVRQALDLSEQWNRVSDSPLVMGCVVARREFLEQHPREAADFLESYEQSIAYMSDAANLEPAAELVARFGITANQQTAKNALPQCNLTFLSGAEMRSAIQGYYEVLFAADPASIGGGNPDDGFYFLP